MGSIKRKSLKKRLKDLEHINLDSFLELSDPLDALDDAIDALDNMFGEDSGSGYDGGAGGYTYSVRRGAASIRHDTAMTKHASRMKKHDAAMKRHDVEMERRQRHLSIDDDGNLNIIVGDNTEHKHTIKFRDTITDTTITITFNDENNYAVTSNTGTIPDSDEIKRRIRNYLNETPPKMPENETFKEHELSPRTESVRSTHCEPLFWSRSWSGGKKKPIEINTDSKVTVSGHNMFGRKYEVRIDGNAIYVPEVEELIKYCYDKSCLDALVEIRSDEEKEILRKIIDGLIALKIAETHHTELKELL